MIIDNTNYEIGNKAMASVLLLYYHLLNEGGITNDQTVYLDQNDFNGYDFLGLEVREGSGRNLDLDEALIREGAVIYLLCDLDDIIGEYEEDFHCQPQTKKIIGALKEHETSPISEVALLLELIAVPENEFNHPSYDLILQGIYKKYVHGFFVKKLA
ncbi:hypothetical protein OLEAN_C21910 [Oleispira antarctica RB-8]|uniref:Uncharacterized protein n=1 Tax=Oleispira antarctica RB-8 TaxID=698738 RepID=R4YN50_OLEAN|nr:hypothetical protein OLEAN_C21910 [Oleispira antarctica RB-8]